MFQHHPTLGIVPIASNFLTTTSTITTLTTSVTVPANGLIVCPLLFATNVSSAGLCTLNASAGGWGLRIYGNFVSASGAAATHGCLIFQTPNEMPSGTTLTFTRDTNWPNGEASCFYVPGASRIQNFQSVGGTLTAGQVYNITSQYTGGTVSTSDFRKTNATLILMSSPANNQVAGIAGGGNPGYAGTGMIAVGGGSGTTLSGFSYLRATTIYPLTQPGNQSFLFQANATQGGTWGITAYRIVGA